MTSLALAAHFAAGYAGARPLAILAAPFSHASGAARGAQAKRARRGEIDQFLASIEHKAFVLARAALGEREAALDVVQDSMLKLIERYLDRPEAEWPALFFTILYRRIQDVRRFRRLRQGWRSFVEFFTPTDEEPNANPPEWSLPSDAPGPDEAHANARLRARLEAALAELPERQRQVLVLREWQDLSVKETAQVLHLSEGSVKQHHFRGLRAMRALLAEDTR